MEVRGGKVRIVQLRVNDMSGPCGKVSLIHRIKHKDDLERDPLI